MYVKSCIIPPIPLTDVGLLSKRRKGTNLANGADYVEGIHLGVKILYKTYWKIA